MNELDLKRRIEHSTQQKNMPSQVYMEYSPGQILESTKSLSEFSKTEIRQSIFSEHTE